MGKKNPSDLKPGVIITGPFWEEPIEIKSIEYLKKDIQISGEKRFKREHIDHIVSIDDLDKIKILNAEPTFENDSTEIFLALETLRYRFASLYDPLLAVNVSKVDPLPHQIEAVYGYILKLPRIRFLIADDPGAGKTIMAGLIIKELKLRNLVKKILIIVPGHLKDQWRRELEDRFKEKFTLVNRNILYASWENLWMKENQIITSMDFAKQEDIIKSFSSVHFDLIIVDEAHKMSAYRYIEKVDKTQRYRLGEILSKITDHLLFLTATPHKGDEENFRLFLDLLEPGFFATKEMFQESKNNKENPLFIRRLKEDLKDFEGKPLFLPRYVNTIKYNLGINSPEEKELYNELSKYVESQYNLALSKDKKRNIAFALVILQRRFASSIYALMKSLERRKNRLNSLLSNDKKEEGEIYRIDLEEVEELSEEERWEKEELWEALSAAETKEELEKEIATIDLLIEKSKEIIKAEKEIKLKELKNAIQTLSEKYQEHNDKKIVIFTESKDTLDYLEKKVKEWGYSVAIIHGGMSYDERIKAEGIFKNEKQILIATEAAGEGINLQFCHLMINYDIPWNPNRLEQRMGRIHRYGQTKEVYIVNLAAEDTREGKVLLKLFDKIKQIQDALGKDKVFDVLGEILYGKNLARLLADAAANARNIEDILKEFDIKIDEEYLNKVKETLGESLATQFIDYTRIKELANQARENKLIPEYTESYFIEAFEKAGGEIKKRGDFYSISQIPFEIKKIAEDENFKRSYGILINKYSKITFDKEMAFKNTDSEFVSFGHPLFEAVMCWVERQYFNLLPDGACFLDPDGILDGYILFYEGEIKDGKGATAGKRLFAFYVKGNEVKVIPASIIWDLASGKNEKIENVNVEDLKTKVKELVITELKRYREELLVNRNKQINIKEKYGVKSLEHLILKLDGEIINLYSNMKENGNLEADIKRKEERKKFYESSLEELKSKIEKEKCPFFRYRNESGFCENNTKKLP